MVLDNKKTLLIITFIFIICIVVSFKYIDYAAQNNARQFCEKAYTFQDKNKIIALIPSDFKKNRKNLSISNKSIILRFHTFFITRYECSMLFDENDTIIAANIFYSD